MIASLPPAVYYLKNPCLCLNLLWCNRLETINICVQGCPIDVIPSLRFYVKFKVKQQSETVVEPEEDLPEASVPENETIEANKTTSTRSTVSTYTPSKVPSNGPSNSRIPSRHSSVSTKTSCPAGTSLSGAGEVATSGCRCNRLGETWNGKTCELKILSASWYHCSSQKSRGITGAAPNRRGSFALPRQCRRKQT